MSEDDHVATRSPINVVSLCAGGGGLDLGIRLAVRAARTVCYVEHDVTEAGVLGKGIEAGALDDAPIWSDLLTFDSRAWRGRVDCVAGGFPCQPHSFAGKRLGEFDPRNLWPAVARVVFDIAPDVCFFENVPGILAYYWRDIRPDLQAMGYEVAEGIFSAEAVGAPHLRERLYFMAYRKGGGRRERGESPRSGRQPDRRDEELANAIDDGHPRSHREERRSRETRLRGVFWEFLLQPATDTRWFHRYVWDKRLGRPREGVDVDFLEGRIKFIDPEDPTKDSPPGPNMLVRFIPEGFEL